MEEIYKDILGFEGLYQISNLGKVKSCLKQVFRRNRYCTQYEKVMKNSLTKKGYHRIELCKDGKSRFYLVHKLVARMFLGECSENMQIRHLDGNKINNNLENLKYGTAKENSDDKIIHGTKIRGSKVGTSKLKDEDIINIRELNKKGISQGELAKIYKVTQPAISYIISKRNWN